MKLTIRRNTPQKTIENLVDYITDGVQLDALEYADALVAQERLVEACETLPTKLHERLDAIVEQLKDDRFDERNSE